MRREYSPSILARIVALVAVAVLGALVAMMLVIFRGPPPQARPLPLVTAIALLEGDSVAGGDWTIRYEQAAYPPNAVEGMHRAHRLEKAFAGMRGVPEDRVRLFIAFPPRMGPGPMPLPMPMPMPGAGGPPPFRFDGGPPPLELRSDFILAQRLGAGWRIMTATPDRGRLPWFAVTIGLMLGIFILLLIPAYFVARRISGPLTRLSHHAAGGTPGSKARAEPQGPPEVQDLARALNAMQDRLQDYVQQRTDMLAAIAHDLRTPMTRLSFRLEQLPTDPRGRAQGDIDEMRGMIDALLNFVRGGQGELQPARIDLAALLETLADDYADTGASVSFDGGERQIVTADPAQLRRCVGNVLDNALRYAGGASIRLDATSRLVRIIVEDEGPGVSPDQLARLSEPFYRGDASRNRETGGIGLGLAIAREGMERQGGSISFANRTEGGLRVTLTLPAERSGVRT